MSSYSPTGSAPSRSPSMSSQTSNGSTLNGFEGQGDVPTAVHSLLGSTRRLQGVLKDWSNGRAAVTDVSDVYVQIGTEFNTVIHAFAYHQIDLSDIHSIPQDMRSILEQCLAEEPTPEVLVQYTPDLKEVLVKLLKGLQSRQETWRARAVVEPNQSRNSSPRNSA